MIWTKKHSQNAVAAKARLRIARAQQAEQESLPPMPSKTRLRKVRPDFTIRIEDRFGDRLQITIHRYLGRVHISGGFSVRQLCRGLEHLLTKSA